MPRALTIAGSDSSGGAGIQADVKTMLANGVHGMTVLTAVTAQNSLGVQGVWELPPEQVEAQFHSVVGDGGVDAVKTGMLGSPELVRTVARLLRTLPPGVPVVVDPVAASTHGEPLTAIAAVRDEILPLATVVTPNLTELRQLMRTARGTSEAASDPDGMRAAAAQQLLEAGARWVLVKGGHDTGPESIDVLYGAGVRLEFAAPRSGNPNTHGTGCTLASAIASHLARGADVPTAVAAAKTYLTGALTHAYPLGSGPGTLQHAWLSRLDK